MAATTALPTTFRAYVFEGYGDALEQIKLRSDVPQAPLAPTQVRIKVHAAAVNPIDYKIVEYGARFFPSPPTADRPFRLGFDVAGTVVEVGADVAATRPDLLIGTAVYSMTTFTSTGSFAEYIALDAQLVSRKPNSLSYEHAAGLALAGQTTYQALVTHGKLTRGQRVLVLGGSSATGAFAIQIAKALGAAYVAATTSARNVELVRSFGADLVIDYTQQQWRDALDAHSIDLICDCGVEPKAWHDDAQIVLKRDSGVFVTIDSQATGGDSPIHATFVSMRTNPSAETLEELTKLVDAGQLIVPVDSVHAFENLLNAVTVQKSGRARGKIVLQVLTESHSEREGRGGG